jgi:CRP/FNR family transcriptional regulator, cyclic AMP receptor protein
MSSSLRRLFGTAHYSPKRATSKRAVFDVTLFLESNGLGRTIIKFRQKETVLSQGDPAKNVIYIQDGGVKLSVVSTNGKEAVVQILGPGDFFGVRSLGRQAVYAESATTIVPTSVLVIEKNEMIRVLHSEHEMSERFIANMMARNVRMQESLIDHLFNSSEKRLARILLLLARYGTQDQPQESIPQLSQEMLAEMIGTTCSRVNFFMNKFRKLGFIEYDSEIHVNKSLLTVLLND